jgi:hypothetical protein
MHLIGFVVFVHVLEGSLTHTKAPDWCWTPNEYKLHFQLNIRGLLIGLKLQCRPRCTVRTIVSWYAAGLDAIYCSERITNSPYPHVRVLLAAIPQGKAEGLSWQHWRTAGVSRMRDTQDVYFPSVIHTAYCVFQLCHFQPFFPSLFKNIRLNVYFKYYTFHSFSNNI